MKTMEQLLMLVMRCGTCRGTVACEVIAGDSGDDARDIGEMVLRHAIVGNTMRFEKGPVSLPTCGCLKQEAAA